MTGTPPHYTDDRITLHLGDSLNVLPTLPDASIDAVICDPPYGLEFMGKEWDGADGFRRSLNPADVGRDSVFGRTSARAPEYRTAGAGDKRLFQAWCETWARECLRVLKPGGHLLAFGAPRTYHRLAAGIEDAGFEIRDSIHWVYGCLTADVEVLTEQGWRRGIDVQPGDPVAQWDAATGEISLAEVQRTYRAPWHGDLVRLRNSDTDQALTPNHRVWRRNSNHRSRDGRDFHEWGPYTVCEAKDVPRRSASRLPLGGEHDGPGIGGTDYAALLGWVWTEGGYDPKWTGVRIYQSSSNQPKVDEIAALMDRVGSHKRYDQPRRYMRRNGQILDYTAVTWFFTGDLANQVRADLPGKHPTYELLWRMTLAEKRAFLDAALKGDGSQGRTGAWQFYQNDPADREWFVTLLAMVGWRGHGSARKAPRTGGSVSVSQRADTTLSTSALKDDREFYEGDVWCVQVPTGAFVARRHGKIFVTGNSGFPKSLDVSKAIDKAAGAEREVVGHTSAGASGLERVRRVEQGYRPNLTDVDPSSIPVTAPATDDAARWSGWGTALKPAWEPIVVARKSLVGTVAANALEHGTGAMNIDACRVASADANPSIKRRQEKPPAREVGSWANDRRSAEAFAAEHPGESLGRWPTNLVLTHSQDCEPVGERVIRGDSRTGQERGTRPGGFGNVGADGGSERPNGQLHGPEAVEVFRCAPLCPVAEMDRQSGITPSNARADKGRGLGYHGADGARGAWTGDDGGGASRYFPVFKYEAKAPASQRPRLADGTAHATVKPLDLMRWLVRLVTPPGGTVLDPFAGSGTTGEAAILEGFNAVLIEREPPYAELIVARLRKPLQPSLFGEAA